jgi:hypothetical protein
MKLEQLEASLSRVNDWIKAVDQKISIALVFEVGVIALIAKPTYSRVLVSINSVGLAVGLLIAVGAIMLVASLLWSILALKPNTGKPHDSGSLIFFGSIAGMSLKTFKARISKTTNSRYTSDLVEQIHINSKIALRKHRLLSQSLTMFLVGIILLLITMAVIVG